MAALNLALRMKRLVHFLGAAAAYADRVDGFDAEILRLRLAQH